MVHLPIVLVPLVAIAAMLLALRRDLRQRFGLALIGASALSCVAVFLAKQSGEGMFQYMNQAPAIARHQSLAKVTVILTFLLLIAIVAMVVAQRQGKARPRSRTAVALSSVTIALSLLAFVGIIQTGHEGAKVTWQSGKAGG
jgi:preprotein translocase subunit SecG